MFILAMVGYLVLGRGGWLSPVNSKIIPSTFMPLCDICQQQSLSNLLFLTVVACFSLNSCILLKLDHMLAPIFFNHIYIHRSIHISSTKHPFVMKNYFLIIIIVQRSCPESNIGYQFLFIHTHIYLHTIKL